MPLPFNSFRLRLTLVVGGFSLAIGAAIVVLLSQVASSRMTQESGDTLKGVARAVSYALAENLRERDREVALLSQSLLLTQGNLTGALLRQRLAMVKKTYRYYDWIGVAAPDGTILSAVNGLLEGENVAQRPWFRAGKLGSYIGDVHEAVLLAKKLNNPNPMEPLRFVDFSAPVLGVDGKLRAVLGSHANWAWVGDVIVAAVGDEGLADDVEVFIVDKNGNTLYPYVAIGQVTLPPNLPGNNDYTVLSWRGAEPFLTTQFAVTSPTSSELGWRVVVRQPMSQALASVSAMNKVLLGAGLLATLLFMGVVYRLAARFSRPLEQLAQAAQTVNTGKEDPDFSTASGIVEIRHLSQALQNMSATMVARRHALEESHRSLEHKVAERTQALSAANRELEQLARCDALTGLYNRLALNEKIRGEFLRMKRTGQHYAILLADVDHFKKVNDTYGHETGDAVLKQVAQLLAQSARTTDFVARFGGEEFLVILPDTTQESALLVAEKLRQAVETTPAAVVGRITLSVGLSAASLEDESEEHAIKRADMALYEAKADGRNCVRQSAPRAPGP